MNHQTILIKKLVLLLIGIAVGLSAQPVWAQELPEDERATFIFDIDVTRLLNSEMVTEVGPNILSRLINIENMFSGVTLSDVAHVSGKFELSETWESIEAPGMGNKDFPIDFYLQVRFVSDELISQFEKDMEGNSEIYEENGKTYYGPPESEMGPTNIRVRFSGKLMEAGTTKYIHDTERIVLTEALEEIWYALPADTIARVAFDVDASRSVVNGFTNEFKDIFAFAPSAEMVADTTLKFIDDIKYAGGYIDLDREKIMSLSIVGNDDKANEKIAGVTNGLIFMGALPIKNAINLLPFESDDETKPLLALADQLKTENEGGKVVMEIIKPEGFDELARTSYYPQLKRWGQTYQLRVDLETIGQAAINFSYSNDENLPFHVSGDSGLSQDLSWRARVLRYGYTGAIYLVADKVNILESWEHADNQEIANSMPSPFGAGESQSNIVWVKTKVKKFDDITDPRNETIMLIRLPKTNENNWLQPGDDISMIKVIQLVSKLKDGEQIFAATYNGNVITLDNSWDHNQIKSYLTPAAGDND